jgi:hypothetical protein
MLFWDTLLLDGTDLAIDVTIAYSQRQKCVIAYVSNGESYKWIDLIIISLYGLVLNLC